MASALSSKAGPERKPQPLLDGAILPTLIFLAKVRTFGRPMFVFMLLVMVLLATTELGTDSWVSALMTPVLSGNFGANAGNWVLVYTSAIMFALRFCAHFIETKLGLSPVGLLLVSAVLAFLGLRFASGMNTFPAALAALAAMGLVWLAGFVLLYVGIFKMRAALEEHYNTVEPINLRLSGVMTFFFPTFYFQHHFTRIAQWKKTGILQPQ